MRASPCVRLETSLETRISLLLEEYQHFVGDLGMLHAQLECLTALHGRDKIGLWKDLAARGQWRDFVGRLLLEHYDPAYRRSSALNFLHLSDAPALRIADIGGFEQAALALLRHYAARNQKFTGEMHA
jgi:tRNA 2-selenouridine synthase